MSAIITSMRVHRFYDAVAISLNDSATGYIDPDGADRLADTLREYAKDIRAQGFTHSTLGTRLIEGKS